MFFSQWSIVLSASWRAPTPIYECDKAIIKCMSLDYVAKVKVYITKWENVNLSSLVLYKFDQCAAAVSYERWAGCYLKAWEPVWAVY